jgi:hypothetical protein
VKGFAAEIHARFPTGLGWFPAEYAWDCHLMWSATFGPDFVAAEYLSAVFLFLKERNEHEEEHRWKSHCCGPSAGGLCCALPGDAGTTQPEVR